MKETVTHNQESYVFDSEDARAAQVKYLGDGHMPDHCHTVYYDYELSGVHDGPPIKVRMVGPDYEYDEYGGTAVWDKLLFADDGVEVESGWILDFYTPALHDDLSELIRETWD